MSQRAVVSGLPVYNGERYLAAAIESHLAQTYGDFQLVISDNGSTDATADICNDYASRDGRIKVLRSNENRGILWNHRRVFEAVESPRQYFRWAAADDVLEPDLFKTMVDVLEARPEVEAVVPDTKNIDSDDRPIGSMSRTLDLQSPDPFERARAVLTGGYQMVIAFGLFRASTLQRMRTKPDYLGWDFVFLWELALRTQIVQTSGAALLRRFHPGATSHVKTAREMRKWVEPNSSAGMSFPHWTWAYERARALMGSPLPLRERWRIGLMLARVTTWQRDSLTRDLTQAARRMLRLSDEYTF